MTRRRYFLDKPETRKYDFKGTRLELELAPNVFPPSSHLLAAIKHLQINPGERVIDVGTGSGLLAIMAAKLGSIVSATDTSQDAVELARKNAQRNQVTIDIRQGSFFGNFQQPFDVILGNLPQEILPPAFEQEIGPELAQTISGGPCGNSAILEFLKLAKDHMHAHSRIYTVVYGMTHYVETLLQMTANYHTRLLAQETVTPKEFFDEHLDFFLSMLAAKKIILFKENGEWKTHLFTVELTLKDQNARTLDPADLKAA